MNKIGSSNSPNKVSSPHAMNHHPLPVKTGRIDPHGVTMFKPAKAGPHQAAKPKDVKSSTEGGFVK